MCEGPGAGCSPAKRGCSREATPELLLPTELLQGKSQSKTSRLRRHGSTQNSTEGAWGAPGQFPPTRSLPSLNSLESCLIATMGKGCRRLDREWSQQAHLMKPMWEGRLRSHACFVVLTGSNQSLGCRLGWAGAQRQVDRTQEELGAAPGSWRPHWPGGLSTGAEAGVPQGQGCGLWCPRMLSGPTGYGKGQPSGQQRREAE